MAQMWHVDIAAIQFQSANRSNLTQLKAEKKSKSAFVAHVVIVIYIVETTAKWRQCIVSGSLFETFESS
jgi:hypothetical protein